MTDRGGTNADDGFCEKAKHYNPTTTGILNAYHTFLLAVPAETDRSPHSAHSQLASDGRCGLPRPSIVYFSQFLFSIELAR